MQYTRGFSSVTGIYQLELAKIVYSLLDAWTAPMCACTRRPCVHCMPIGTQSFVPLTHQPFASKTFSILALKTHFSANILQCMAKVRDRIRNNHIKGLLYKHTAAWGLPPD